MTPTARAQEAQILGDALNALARTTGVKAKKLAQEPKAKAGWTPDAEIVVENLGKQYRYLAEIKHVDRFAILAHVKQQLQKYGQNGVLVAPYLTAELADHCRQNLDLQFIDTVGNVYLKAPGLFVYVRGERPPNELLPYWKLRTPLRGRTAGGTGTALRVILALLCRPDLLNAPYRDIVAAANVALGAVGWVFHDLEARGLIVGGTKKGNRRFTDLGRVAREWATNYPIKLRPRLAIGTFRAANPDWWRLARLKEYGAVWGGEVAADRLTGNREPGQFTIYLPRDPAKFVIDHRLRADPRGDIEILRRFWTFELQTPFEADLAPPILVYAELMATVDPRNHQTAQLLYDRFLADAYGKAR